MRQFETKVQELKHSVLRETARLAWEDKLTTGVLDIPEKIIPGPEPSTRCCIYKERAIINARVKLAMGGDRSNPNVVEVLNVACDECPVTEISVGPACRGCIATRCVHACPKGAITVVNHKATIDHSQCIVCGKCVAACPYGAIEKHQRPCEKGCPVNAIAMGPDKKAAIDINKCIGCGACTYQCPFGAIMDKSWIVDTIQMLKGSANWGYKVYAVVAPAIAGQFAPASLGQVVAGLKQLGFTAVTEVAQGADMVADHEADELVEKGVLTSSCCPGFVGYVKRHHPEMEKFVSHTPSPMVMIGLHLKEKEPNAKVVFIGPCVAKKTEFQLGRSRNSIDSVLTFEELAALFDSKDIELADLGEEALEDASGYGRGFAASGGVSEAVVQALKEKGSDFEVKAVPCSGIEECKLALLKLGRGLLDGNFVEGMACVGGCIQGPANITRTPKNKQELEAHKKTAQRAVVTEAAAAAGKTEKPKKDTAAAKTKGKDELV